MDEIRKDRSNSLPSDSPPKYDPKDPDTYIYDVTTQSPGGEKKEPIVILEDIDTETGTITQDIALDTTLQYVTKTLDCSDDPSISPYTVCTGNAIRNQSLTVVKFRAFFIGIGLAAFGAVIGEIFYFKPQTVTVNTIFLQIIAFPMGELTTLIPRSIKPLSGRLGPISRALDKVYSPVGRLLNPGPFTMKEHIFITICASSGAVSALGTEQLAAQSL